MALRRSQRNAEKPSDELEPMNLESEPMTIEVEEVQMPVESKDDKETQPSKKKKIIGPNTDKQQKHHKYQQAASDYHAGKFKTIRQAAKEYDVAYTTLYEGIVKRGAEFSGSGRYTSRLTPVEESKIVDHVKWRASVGYGMDWNTLGLLFKEVFAALKKSNPERETGLENNREGALMFYIRRFAERHQLVLRSSMAISKGRQVVSSEELALWQSDAWRFFSQNPDLLAALQVDNNVV